MIVKPKIRGFICTTAHPQGCRQNVLNQIEYVKSQGKTKGPKKVLVIGASTGYGLASRISAAFGCGAATIGIIFDKQGQDNRTGTAGWYNTAAFEEFAAKDNLYASTINGDGFSKEIKEQAIKLIKKDLDKVDMVIYSLAAPRRTAEDGTVYSSVLKTTEKPYTNKTIDLKTKKISEVTVTPATEEEIMNTVKVMGGEDWKEWIKELKEAEAITDNAVTVAYSYIGPELTHPMYYDGSIGAAKAHLLKTAKEITGEYSGIKAYISVNKALVTQSSAAIPIVPLYISILYKVMKEHNVHEGCIEQMYRLFKEKLPHTDKCLDAEGRIRLDDLEMMPDIQKEVSDIWDRIDDSNIDICSDIDGYWKDFNELFGFDVNGVDYDADTDIVVPVKSIE